MSTSKLQPYTDTPQHIWLKNVRHLAKEDLAAARQSALLRLLWLESFHTRPGLIVRVEDILWRGCFGPAAQSTFRRDIAVVRQTFAAAGHRLRYSRRPGSPGYHVEGRPRLDEGIVRLIAGAVAEVDPAQMAISRQLTPAQQVQQANSMIRIAEQVGAYRLCQRQPHLNEGEVYQILRRGPIVMTKKSDMDFVTFMRLVLDAVEAANIQYLIGGSVAVWAWGEPRTTRDFDLVVNVPLEAIPPLSQELEKRDMLVPVDIILDLLIKTEGDLAVNAIHLYTGYKAEFFLLRYGDIFRATALARRRLVDLGPPLGEVYVHAPEDLILNKVRYFGLSHQPKHIRDISSMFFALGDTLDFVYIEAWAAYLNLTRTWHEVREQAENYIDF